MFQQHFTLQVFKGAPKLYFMRYSFVVIILFNTEFSTYSCGKLVLPLSVFCGFYVICILELQRRTKFCK